MEQNDPSCKILSSFLKAIKVPSRPWINCMYPSFPVYVQDVVHLAVKMKVAALKSGNNLIMGSFNVAARPIFLELMSRNNRMQHGLQQRFIDQKDKMNFTAVLRLINAANHLDGPESTSVVFYFHVIDLIVKAWLERSLTMDERITFMWTALFVMRIWKDHILKHPDYNLANNFPSRNVAQCIELNACALILINQLHYNTPDLRDRLIATWVMTSQPCEKFFRALRSMSPIFSAVSVFGIYSMLSRIQKLQLLADLESDTENGIIFPRVERHGMKDGMGVINTNCKAISFKAVENAVSKAFQAAKEIMAKLGVSVQEMCIGIQPTSDKELAEMNDDPEDDEIDDSHATEDVEIKEKTASSSSQEMNRLESDEEEDFTRKLSETCEKLMENLHISDMEDSIESQGQKLVKVKQLDGIPIYKLQTSQNVSGGSGNPRTYTNINPFVEWEDGTWIRKSSVIFQFEERQSVSTDRLIRVTEAPSLSKKKVASAHSYTIRIPCQLETITENDICIFGSVSENSLVVVKVLKFCYLSGG